MTVSIDPTKPVHLIRVLGRESLFYDDGRICLGWSDVEHVPSDVSEYIKAYKHHYADPVKYDLLNFRHEVNEADVAAIITGDGCYSVVEVLDYEYRPDWNKGRDASHTRAYRAIKIGNTMAMRIPRTHFIPKLRHRLGQGSRGLTCYPIQPQGSSVDEYRELLADSLKLWFEKRPFSVKEVCEDALAKELLQRIQNELHHPGQLEDLLKDLLLKSGAREAERNPTKQAKAGDIDVEAVYAVGWEDPEDFIRIGIQAKWRKGEQTQADREGFEQLSARLADPSRVIEKAYLVTTATTFPDDLIESARALNTDFENKGMQLSLRY